MIPELCDGCKFKCESPDVYWGMLEGCANREIEVLKAEVEACYLELHKLHPSLTAVYDRSVHERVAEWAKKCYPCELE